jgi:hypothetical protein
MLLALLYGSTKGKTRNFSWVDDSCLRDGTEPMPHWPAADDAALTLFQFISNLHSVELGEAE